MRWLRLRLIEGPSKGEEGHRWPSQARTGPNRGRGGGSKHLGGSIFRRGGAGNLKENPSTTDGFCERFVLNVRGIW